MKFKAVYLSLIFIILLSCKDIYYPDINNNEKILVVNGVITNENKTHLISLMWARPINGDNAFEPVTDAKVIVTDKSLLRYDFKESYGGKYFSDSSLFIPCVGNSYKLTVVLENGDIYESDSQELLPIDTLGEVTGRVVQRDFVLENDNSTIVQTYEGIETFISYSNSDHIIPTYRFNTNVIAQYSWGIDLGATQHTYYCWIKLRNPNTNINITNSTHDVDVDDNILHSLCFLPKSLDYWDLTKPYNCFVIDIEAYRLNRQSYLFYKKAYDQLAANNSLFDPIAVQLPSNIKCVSDSHKKAIGYFEASSLYKIAYYIFERNSSEILCPNNPDYPSNLNNTGWVLDTVPSFWYTNFLK